MKVYCICFCVIYVLTWLHYWQGYGLAIHRLWVRVLAGHHCIVGWASHIHLCASVSKQYKLVLAKGSDPFGWESNCAPGGK